jgi:hypothetical protein
MPAAIGLSALVAFSSGLALAALGCTVEGVPVTDELPIRDNFSGECEWAEGEDDDVSYGCRDGEYRILFDGSEGNDNQFFSRQLEEAVSAVAVEADVVVRAFPESQQGDAFEYHGIGCWASSEADQGYLFLIDPSTSEFGIAKQDGGNLSFLVVRSDGVAGIGETNRIRGKCQRTEGGVDLTMFVNGEQVWAEVDPHGFQPFKEVGFLVRSTKSGTDLRYDNFTADAD